MPLTGDERTKIRETELLKEEIRKELAPPPKSDLLKQVILLIVGFVLTGLVGSGLTAFWKNREADNQRKHLAEQRALDKAYALISKTSKEVATTIAAADDVLISYQGTDWTSKEIEEAHENWMRTSRNWRVSYRVLGAEIPPSFSDPQIKAKFDEIIDKRKYLGNAIYNLPRGKKAIQQDKNLKQELTQANDRKNNIGDLLDECVGLMTAQVTSPGKEKAK